MQIANNSFPLFLLRPVPLDTNLWNSLFPQDRARAPQPGFLVEVLESDFLIPANTKVEPSGEIHLASGFFRKSWKNEIYVEIK